MLVPPEEAARLDSVDLADAPRYDQLYQLARALEDHRREDARNLFEAMNAEAPDHRLTWHARRSLAAYDADIAAGLASVEGALACPEDAGAATGKGGLPA